MSAARKIEDWTRRSATFERSHMSSQPQSVEAHSATYRGQKIRSAIIVAANGVHPTSGYSVFFERSSLGIFPPEFSLWHTKPNGIVLDVITHPSLLQHRSRPRKPFIVMPMVDMTLRSTRPRTQLRATPRTSLSRKLVRLDRNHQPIPNLVTTGP